MAYARIVNGHAVDVHAVYPEGLFVAELLAEFVEVPDNIGNGWIITDGVWSEPVIQEPIPVVVTEPVIASKVVSPVEFKLLFTSAERIAIQRERATDPVIEDFFSILDDPRLTQIDLGLASTQEMLGYIVNKGIIQPERLTQILVAL